MMMTKIRTMMMTMLMIVDGNVNGDDEDVDDYGGDDDEDVCRVSEE